MVAPVHHGFFGGLGTSFSTGAVHKLANGAVIQEVTALHVSVGHFTSRPSISTQISALRNLLLKLTDDPLTDAFKLLRLTVRVRQSLTCVYILNFHQGVIPIVVEAHNADVIATLILLKKDVEEKTGATIHMTIAGATEAHLLVKEIAQADIGVIFKPSRPFPSTWEQRRVWVSLFGLRSNLFPHLVQHSHRLPGPPLSNETEVALFLAHNVTVGIGIEEAWSARNTRFDMGWVRVQIVFLIPPLSPRRLMA